MLRKAFAVIGLFFLPALVGCGNPDGDEDTDKESAGSETEKTYTDTEDLSKCAFGNGEYRNYFMSLAPSEAFEDAGVNSEDAGADPEDAEAGVNFEDEVQAKLNEAWRSLFEGDLEDETVYFDAGENENGPMAYIMDIGNNDVRSEGMSYGMMIAVQFDRQDAFDALWNFAKTYMWHGSPSHPFYEYFAWSVDAEGNPYDDAPAADGEEYFAMSLYFAAFRWGNGDGIYNYREAADRLVSAMKNRKTIYGTYNDRGNPEGKDSGLSLFNPETKMPRFSPKAGYFGTPQGDHTDPSYHLPAFYQLWSLWGPKEDRWFWAAAANASRDFFEAAANPDTALTPDYAAFDGAPVAPTWNTNAQYFNADARRSVMNWSVDWAWFCVDERERARSDTLQTFFDAKDPLSQYDAMYELDGTPLSSNYYTPSLTAMNAVSALSATDEERTLKFVEALWNMPVPTGQWRYYDGMLYMLALLHVSGNFRIYSPD